MWSEDEWLAFTLLIDHGWPGTFDDGAAEAWRTLLDRYEPQACVAALQRLVAKGGTFRPSVAELVAEVHVDPSRPSFGEMVQMVYGHPHGALHASAGGEWSTDAQRRALASQAAQWRADELHPLVGAFVASMTVQRLREINLDDPDYGQARRAQLKAEWEDFCQRATHREAHALAAGRERREGLRRHDPLAALGHKQITQGDNE